MVQLLWKCARSKIVAMQSGLAVVSADRQRNREDGKRAPGHACDRAAQWPHATWPRHKPASGQVREPNTACIIWCSRQETLCAVLLPTPAKSSGVASVGGVLLVAGVSSHRAHDVTCWTGILFVLMFAVLLRCATTFLFWSLSGPHRSWDPSTPHR